MKKPIWVVTGGAGFIGSNIVEELVRRGESVRVFDNFSTGRKENLASYQGKIKLFKGDIRNPGHLKKVMKGATYVLHQAALRSVPRSVDNPVDSNEVNITGTLNVLLAARNAGVKRLVYASSSSAYGDSKVFPQVETLTPNPISPYAVSKLAGEHYCMVFARTYRFETVSLRYFNVFGPRQNPESLYSAVIPKFMEQALAGRTLEIHWDGRQSRDFTFIKNVVDANMIAARAPKAAGNVFNIATGTSISLINIVEGLEKILGRKLDKKFLPKRAGDVRRTWANISSARRGMGYKPAVGFAVGLKATWEWYRDRD